MNDDTDNLLNDLLCQWHKWACGYKHVGGINSSPMFRNAKTSKGWDSLEQLADDAIDSAKCEAIDFNVMQLEPSHRTALQLQARNLVTGLSVWSSPRLPVDLEERTVLLMEARNKLLRRLVGAGVV